MSAECPDESFLHTVYQAALEPNLWLKVIEQLADLVGAHPANLSRLSLTDTSGSMIGVRIDPLVNADYFGYYSRLNPLHRVDNPKTYVGQWAPLVYTYEDRVGRERLVRSEYYNDFMRRIGGEWSLVIRLGVEAQSHSSIAMGRPSRNGAYSDAELGRLRRLQPHLVRAYALTDRLSALTRLEAEAAGVFERSPHGLYVLDGEGRISRVNTAGEELVTEGVLSSAAGRLTAQSASVSARLAALIAAAGARSGPRIGGSMFLNTPHRRVPLSLTVTPLAPETRSLFSARPAVLVCVNDPGPVNPPTPDQLQELYGLTPAEARIAIGVFEGLSPREMASRFGVRPNTIRVQLGAVFEKTQTHRQPELMRLLSQAGKGSS